MAFVKEELDAVRKWFDQPRFWEEHVEDLQDHELVVAVARGMGGLDYVPVRVDSDP